MNGENDSSPPFSYISHVYKWLEVALDIGIAEAQFWEMTFAELNRCFESHMRVKKRESQEKASYDYILADLIGKSVARLYSSSNHMPEISEVYPSLFDNKEIEEQKRAKKAELSALRFKQFANFHNSKIKEAKSE